MPKKKSALGDNPLDHLIPSSSTDATTENTAPQEDLAASPPAARPSRRRRVGKKTRKTRATFHLPQDLLERARDTVYWLSGPPTRLTLTDLVTEALTRELRRLEKAHNDGNRYEERDEELRGGRPGGG